MSTTPPPGEGSGFGQSAASGAGTNPGAGQGPGQGAGQSGAARRIEETMKQIETEFRQAVAYVNDEVIPQVRRESITVMRGLSEALRDLADRVERAQHPPRGPQS